MNDTIIPYVGIERVLETLAVAYKKGAKEISIPELASLVGCGVSNINNVTPTLNLLGLTTVEKGIVSITSDGMEFIRAHMSGEIERAKGIIRNGIGRSGSLKFVKSLLETRVQLTGEEIGRALSDRFGKKWKSVPSYRTFGNSCASIIGFAGFGFYQDGVLSLKPLTMKAEAGLYAPEIGFRPIVQLLDVLYSFKKARLSDLAKKSKANERRLAAELTVCVSLRLVEKDSTGSYSITEIGSKLIDPLLPTTSKTEVFRECLLTSPYADVLLGLSQAGKELTYEDVGETLEYLLRRDWSPVTKKIYGKKFITWLNAAGILEKISRNRFKLKAGIMEEIKKSQVKVKAPDATMIYEVGRILGALETLSPNDENKKEFEDRISVLKSLLKNHVDLELVLDLLGENFKLASETKNPSIYKTNIEFVRDKVKEKLGMLS